MTANKFSWACPACRSAVRDTDAALQCTGCRRTFGVVGDIPDFRLSVPRYLDPVADLALARRLAESNLPLEQLVRSVYAQRDDPARAELRTREVLSGSEELHGDLRRWLKPITAEGPFLDLGCGGGMLMAAASDLQPGLQAIGIDASMAWLVVAQKYARDHGGDPILAAAMAEALPFGDETIPAVISLDVIEHVEDPDAYLAEINRVLQPGGRLALSTPNRFSLTAEPHVHVWGVGWLPQSLQSGYVWRRSRKTYDDTVLMSSSMLARRLQKNTALRFKIVVPKVPAAHMVRFPSSKRAAARFYNWISQVLLLRPAFLFIAPFFRVTAIKAGSLPERVPIDASADMDLFEMANER